MDQFGRGTISGKTFCIGLSKTGTLSLHLALEGLGLRSIHYPPAAPMLAGDYAGLASFDAAGDIPVGLFFRELDDAYPGSRFILTVRDLGSWLGSIERHLAARPLARVPGGDVAGRVRELTYGAREFDRDRYAEAFTRHHERVHRHFADRRRDLLVLNICGGEGWTSLCPFLGLPIPDRPFPHAHKRASAAA